MIIHLAYVQLHLRVCQLMEIKLYKSSESQNHIFIHILLCTTIFAVTIIMVCSEFFTSIYKMYVHCGKFSVLVETYSKMLTKTTYIDVNRPYKN